MGTWYGQRPSAQQKKPRRKEEINKERLDLRQRTERELDAVVKEFHEKLPRSESKAIGAAYARYSSRFQDSVVDQVRTIMKAAVEQGIFIPREMIFFDLAVRGFKKYRIGLSALEKVLQEKRVNALLLFSTNRLFRKTYRTLEFVDKIHKSWGLRCIFVTSGIDTNDKDRWELLLQLHSIIDQAGLSMYVKNIQAAHQGLLAKGLVYGTITFGYFGEPIPGEFTRRNKQVCRIKIDPETSSVVKLIFHQYLIDLLPIDEIVRRLNDGDYPLPPRTTTGLWSRAAVIGVLKNRRYLGCWQYGEKEAVFLVVEDYVRQRPRARRSPRCSSKSCVLSPTNSGLPHRSDWRKKAGTVDESRKIQRARLVPEF